MTVRMAAAAADDSWPRRVINPIDVRMTGGDTCKQLIPRVVICRCRSTDQTHSQASDDPVAHGRQLMAFQRHARL
jgi:hypothetical protein